MQLLSCTQTDAISSLSCNYITAFSSTELSELQQVFHCALTNAKDNIPQFSYECSLTDNEFPTDDSNHYENSNQTKFMIDCLTDNSLKFLLNNIVDSLSEFLIKLPKLFIYDTFISNQATAHGGNLGLNSSNYIANRNDCDINQILLNCSTSDNFSNNYNDSSYSSSASTSPLNANFNDTIRCIVEYIGEFSQVNNASTIENISSSYYLNGTIIQDFDEASATAIITNQTDERHFEWTFLFVILFILAGGLGNILVCLAIALDRKLQNVTNYFLLSLAVADLLVSLFVMPLGAVPGFLGEYKDRLGLHVPGEIFWF